MLALLGLTARMAQVQLLEHERYAALAQRQQTVRRALSGRRGNIYDRKGRLLATSVQRWSVFADPSRLKRPRATALLLARALGMDAEALTRRLRRRARFVWVKRHVTDAEADTVRGLSLAGIHLQREYDRLYPTGRLCAHVVGFTDVDGRGLSGVELEFDRILRGRPGREELLCDAARRALRLPGSAALEEPADGLDVYLTLDAYVQNVALEALTAQVRQHEPECAWALVLDARSGAVLADVVVPGFDPQAPGRYEPARRRNRVVTDAYEFGSVLKPLTVAAAIEEGLVTPQTQFDCRRGAWRVGRRTVHDVHPYGVLSVSDIVCKSSNIGAAQIGMLLGAERFHRALRRFGLGEPTGIRLPGEVSGILRPPGRWTRDSLISVAFGQEISCTPLGVACAFGALANRGVLLRPRILSKIVHSRTGRVLCEPNGPAARWRAVSESTARAVLEMMRRVVEEGTGRRARLDDYPVAGKTGTASQPRPDGRGYSRTRYLSTFVGIAPANSPRVVALVSLLAPSKGSHYGGTVAAPACREILHRTLRYLNVPAPMAGRAVAEASE